MSKIVLAICLCLSLQGCSNLFDGSKSDIPPILGGKTEGKKQDKNGFLAITEFMAVMSVLKTQVD